MIPQSAAQWRNLLVFVAVIAANIVVISVAAALGADTMPGFRDGEFLRPGRETAIGLLALLAPIISGWIVQNRPSFGSEGLAAEVNDLREQGYSRADLTVVPKATAEPPVVDDTYPVIHRQCGKVAFLALVPPTAFQDLQASECRHVDGRPMATDDPIRCDACSARLMGVMAEAGQWVTVSAPVTFGGS